MFDLLETDDFNGLTEIFHRNGLEISIEEVRSLDGNRIMLVAKVPGFYKTQGFISIDRETAPNISK